MFEYTKTILRKVSFDSILFKRELEKAVMEMSEKERKNLCHWADTNFSETHADVLKEVFENELTEA